MAWSVNQVRITFRDGLIFRQLRHVDLPSCVDIDELSFEASHRSSVAQLQQVLNFRNVSGLVAENAGSVVAFALWGEACPYSGLLGLAVHPAFRRRGIGSRLIDIIANGLRSNGVAKLRLIIVESNLPAHQFFRACGFQAVQVHRECFERTSEDGYVFERTLCATDPVATAP
jgi:ribosomal-protein-alanine N-acetyltransferase